MNEPIQVYDGDGVERRGIVFDFGIDFKNCTESTEKFRAALESASVSSRELAKAFMIPHSMLQEPIR